MGYGPSEEQPVRIVMDPEFARDIPSHIISKTETDGPVLRRVRLIPRNLKEAGFMVGCPGCNAGRTGGAPQGHNQACRSRIQGYLETTEEGREIEEEQRQNHGHYG